MGTQVRSQDATEVRFGRAIGWPVVVGQIDVRDPTVERAPDDGPLGLDRPVVTKVLPQAE